MFFACKVLKADKVLPKDKYFQRQKPCEKTEAQNFYSNISGKNSEKILNLIAPLRSETKRNKWLKIQKKHVLYYSVWYIVPSYYVEILM